MLIFSLLLVSAPEAAMSSNLPVNEKIREHYPENKFSSDTEIKTDEYGLKTEFLFSLGYRSDDFDWNIAGNTILGNYVNVLSELTWRNIEIYQVKLRNRTCFHNGFLLQGSLGYGWIFAGDNQDSDYLGINRTIEYSRSNAHTGDDNVLDASLGVGYQFRLKLDNLRITPLIGYSYHQQNFTMTDGDQTIASQYTTPAGPIAGLDSTYKAAWSGPWIGLDMKYKFNERHGVYLEIEYHWADYYAEANWNLRTDLAHPKSFEHEADGNGFIISTGLNVFLNPQWTLSLNFDYQKWSTGAGIDRVFLSNGRALETLLNEVNWKSNALMIGIIYHWQ